MHREEGVLGFFSSRPNWDPPSTNPQGSVSPPPFGFGGTHSLEKGVGVPIRTRGQTL
jgi:hypothetical protein